MAPTAPGTTSYPAAFGGPLVFVDVETTGGSWRTHEMIEIAALRVEDGELVDKVCSLIKPSVFIPPYITTITGIDDATVADAPAFREIADRIASLFADDAIFVAHNAAFDYGFVTKALDESGAAVEPRKFCTVRLSRKLYGSGLKHSLEQIIRRHGIQVENRHRAQDDAQAMWEFVKIAWNEHTGEPFAAAVAAQLDTSSTA